MAKKKARSWKILMPRLRCPYCNKTMTFHFQGRWKVRKVRKGSTREGKDSPSNAKEG